MTIVLEVYEGHIHVALEVGDGRGGIDQTGAVFKYDPSAGNCQ